MIGLGAVLLVCAWLWWIGMEVPSRPWAAAALGAAAFLALWAGYMRSGRRLPAGRRLGRSAGWALAVVLLAALLGGAIDPLLEWAGPFVSHRTAPASMLAALARGFGLDATSQPGRLVVQDLAAVPDHAASWQQMALLPALALLTLFGMATACRTRGWLRGVGAAALVLAAWLPVRFLLVTRVVEDLGWLGVHWHPIAVGASLLPAVWLAGRIRPLRSLARLPVAVTRRGIGLAAAGAAGAALIAFGLAAAPPGRPASGRVLLDDAHSDWEWTNIPLDREHYGRAFTYSYVSLVDFLAHHYDVSTNAGAEITRDLLERFDVLVLKTPTRPYLEREREAIVGFVERGGGLLLISDHTNLFGMTTNINPIGEPFGVEFHTDDTYDLTSGQPSIYRPPRLGAHPAVARMPSLGFETSCTLRPSLRLRPLIVGRALGSEPADYSHVNFFGNISPDPGERWGMFLQAASATRGRGRVIAFTDSTVFSSFSVFFRGKPELALGMVEFLNRGRGRLDALPRLAVWAGLLAIAVPAALAWRRRRRAPGRVTRASRRSRSATAVPAAALAAVVGLAAGGSLATRFNAGWYPPPAVRAPMTVVGFETSHSTFRLPTLLEATVPDPDRCFDAFFVALQRLHLFPRVADDLRAATRGSRVAVLLNPASSPAEGELRELYDWVRAGGRLLLMEPQRGVHLAANRFLEPAGIRISAAFPGQPGPSAGGLAIYGGGPARLLEDVARAPGAPGKPVAGGTSPEPSAPTALVSITEVGAGRVVLVLGSERFSFQAMGPAFNNPNAAQRAIYEQAYALFEKDLIPESWPHECRLAGRVGDAASLQ